MKYTWEEKKRDDDIIEVVIGDLHEHLLIDGIAHLSPFERAEHIQALLEHRLRQRKAEAHVDVKFVLGHILPSESTQRVAPPVVAEALLALFTPKASCDAVLGDLQEMLETDTGALGEKHARRRYWMRVCRNVGPSIWRKIMGLGIVTVLINYGRSKLGL